MTIARLEKVLTGQSSKVTHNLATILVTVGDQLVRTNQSSAANDQRCEASIIIVNYNAGDKLLHCLSGVVRFASSSTEIFVVDNGSTDGAADAIERDFPEIVVIRSGTNLGFGGGCNLAAKKAEGQHLVFLNPDTIVEDDWLRALISPLKTAVNVGLATSKILLAGDPTRINACGNSVHITGIALCRGLGRSRDELNEPGEVAAVSGAAFAIRRELFELLGGFDETMFLYVEDTDLSLRARLAGWRSVCAPESIVRHDYSLKMSALKVFFQERNRYLMLIKILRLPTLVVLFPVLILAEFMTWGFVLLRDRANIRNKVRAYYWILSNWREIMAKRKATQSLRKAPDRDLLRQTDFRIDFDQAGVGVTTSAARYVFDPVFLLLRAVAMTLVWW